MADSNPHAPSIAWLAWQAAENSLKALAASHSIPYSHDLDKLMNHVKANNVVRTDTYNDLLAAVQSVTISGSYNALRYPDDNPLFWENMSPEHLKPRVEAARKIYEICKENVQVPTHAFEITL